MKKIALLSLLIIFGISFAVTVLPGPVPMGPEWSVYAQTCCQAYSLAGTPFDGGYNWAGDVEGYQVGISCSFPSLTYYDVDIWNMMWMSEGSVSYYYSQMQMACMGGPVIIRGPIIQGAPIGDPTSPECLAAKRNFYSAARNAKNAFAIAKMEYLRAAQQNLYAYKMGWCQNPPPEIIAADIYDSMQNYRDCMASPMQYCMTAN